METISVITINYNNLLHLEKTILSVVNQTYPLEFIIIDGGSTDGCTDLLQKYQKEITVLISEKDAGIYDAMNKGIKVASGKWLIFMNSGDEFYSNNTLKEMFNSRDNYNNIKCIIGNTVLIRDGSQRIQKANINNMRFIHQSVAYQKELHFKYGFYPVEKYITASDYFFISKIISSENVEVIDQTISKYSAGGVSDNIKTNVQVLLYDYLANRISYKKLLIIMMATPVIKLFLRIKNSLI